MSRRAVNFSDTCRKAYSALPSSHTRDPVLRSGQPICVESGASSRALQPLVRSVVSDTDPSSPENLKERCSGSLTMATAAPPVGFQGTAGLKLTGAVCRDLRTLLVYHDRRESALFFDSRRQPPMCASLWSFFRSSRHDTDKETTVSGCHLGIYPGIHITKELRRVRKDTVKPNSRHRRIGTNGEHGRWHNGSPR